MRLPDPILANARTRPNAPALVAPAAVFSHRSLAEGVARAAGTLAHEGAAPGDRVGLLSPNRIEWILALHAVTRLGAVLVPLHARLSPAEIRGQADRALPKFIL